MGSDNGLSPILCLAIIWASEGLLLIRPMRKILEWKLNQNFKFFIEEDVLENVVSKMLAILPQPK